jgi:hypothetical protein
MFMDAVNDGTIHVKSNELPSFLYDSEEEYNPDAREIGLLRGEVLVQVSMIPSDCFAMIIFSGLPSYLYWTWLGCHGN